MDQIKPQATKSSFAARPALTAWPASLGLKTIYKRRLANVIIMRFLIALLVGLAFLGLLSEAVAPEGWINPVDQAAVLVLLAGLLAAVLVSHDFLVARRARQLLASRPYRRFGAVQTPSQLARSAARAELGPPARLNLIKEAGAYKIYDAVFDIYGQGKAGRVKIAEAYHTIFEARLRRSVPQLVFDSKTAKNRQFAHIYLQAQQLPLEAVLLDRFDAYAPRHYELDALSFITPEVVEAMLALSDRDIEFVGPGLLLYAPLLDARQLAVLESAGQELQRRVNGNLKSYRDSWAKYRVVGSARFSLGRRLVKDPYRHRRWVIFLGSVSAGLVFLALMTSRPAIIFNRASLFVVAAFGLLLAEMAWAQSRYRRLQAIARGLADSGDGL